MGARRHTGPAVLCSPRRPYGQAQHLAAVGREGLCGGFAGAAGSIGAEVNRVGEAERAFLLMATIMSLPLWAPAGSPHSPGPPSICPSWSASPVPPWLSEGRGAQRSTASMVRMASTAPSPQRAPWHRPSKSRGTSADGRRAVPHLLPASGWPAHVARPHRHGWQRINSLTATASAPSRSSCCPADEQKVPHETQ